MSSGTLVIVLTCLLVLRIESDVIQDVKDAAQDGYDKVKGNNTETMPQEPPTAGNDTQSRDQSRDDTPLLNSNYPASDNGLTTTQQEGQIACWECTIEKSMDNRVLGIVDEVFHKNVQGTQCENRVCTGPGQNWCLVTHYKMRAADGQPESKRERHECGNRNYRDSDTRCKTLLTEDKDHNKIIESSCYTKRSGSKSLHSSFTVYLSVILSLAAFAFMH